jgi:hypothetical protein
MGGGQAAAGACYEPAMARDDEIQAIVEIGRRTRAPVPRSLWIAAAIVGAVCTTGLAVALLGEPAPAPAQARARGPIERPSPSGTGWGTGLAVGGAGGLVAGFALGRHRRDHSSRSRP